MVDLWERKWHVYLRKTDTNQHKDEIMKWFDSLLVSTILKFAPKQPHV